MSWGSLDACGQIDKYIPMSALRKYATDVLRGLDYLHQHLCIHRDIRPANILVGQRVRKVSGFRLSCTPGGAAGPSPCMRHPPAPPPPPQVLKDSGVGAMAPTAPNLFSHASLRGLR